MPATDNAHARLEEAVDALEIAMPAPGSELQQDEEWIVYREKDEWRKIRLHDYGEVYAVQGLYEKWIYEAFQCKSPQKVRELLKRALQDADVPAQELKVLDLGAGNGCVAEELQKMGVRHFVGIDIQQEAAEAAERDRPGLYSDYVIGDLTDLDRDGRRTLDRHDFNGLTCVAALGFGDIPPEVFAEAYNRIDNDGWVAFTIKEDFLEESDESGFSRLIRRMLRATILELSSRESYTHRVSTDGEELIYVAFVGRKRSDIPSDLLQSLAA